MLPTLSSKQRYWNLSARKPYLARALARTSAPKPSKISSCSTALVFPRLASTFHTPASIMPGFRTAVVGALTVFGITQAAVVPEVSTTAAAVPELSTTAAGHTAAGHSVLRHTNTKYTHSTQGFGTAAVSKREEAPTAVTVVPQVSTNVGHTAAGHSVDRHTNTKYSHPGQAFGTASASKHRAWDLHDNALAEREVTSSTSASSLPTPTRQPVHPWNDHPLNDYPPVFPGPGGESTPPDTLPHEVCLRPGCRKNSDRLTIASTPAAPTPTSTNAEVVTAWNTAAASSLPTPIGTAVHPWNDHPPWHIVSSSAVDHEPLHTDTPHPPMCIDNGPGCRPGRFDHTTTSSIASLPSPTKIAVPEDFDPRALRGMLPIPCMGNESPGCRAAASRMSQYFRTQTESTAAPTSTDVEVMTAWNTAATPSLSTATDIRPFRPCRGPRCSPRKSRASSTTSMPLPTEAAVDGVTDERIDHLAKRKIPCRVMPDSPNCQAAASRKSRYWRTRSNAAPTSTDAEVFTAWNTATATTTSSIASLPTRTAVDGVTDERIDHLGKRKVPCALEPSAPGCREYNEDPHLTRSHTRSSTTTSTASLPTPTGATANHLDEQNLACKPGSKAPNCQSSPSRPGRNTAAAASPSPSAPSTSSAPVPTGAPAKPLGKRYVPCWIAPTMPYCQSSPDEAFAAAKAAAKTVTVTAPAKTVTITAAAKTVTVTIASCGS